MLARLRKMRIDGRRKRGRAPAAFRLLPGGPTNTQFGSGALAGSFGQTLTFTRGTGKTCLTSDSSLVTLTNNQPAVEPRGLLIEPAATNITLRSEEFDNAAWGKSGSSAPLIPTVTANAATAPDGTLTADQVDFPAVSGAGVYSEVYTNPGISMTAVPYTSSIWLRTASGTATIYLFSTIAGVGYFSVACNVTTTWQRFSLTATYTAATYIHMIGVDLRDGAQTAKSAQTVYAWGAQLELGSVATSYIKTVGTSATRNADVCAVPITGSFPVGSGEIRATVTPQWATTPTTRVLFDTRSAGTKGVVVYVDSSAQLNLLVNAASDTTITSSGLTWTAGTQYRIRAVWGGGNAYLYRNDVLVASATAGTAAMPATVGANLFVGSDYLSAVQWGGNIHSLEVRK